MGRDITAFIERKNRRNVWEVVADDEQLFLHRNKGLFDFLTYNALEGLPGVRQRTLRSWCTTVSPEVRRMLFFRTGNDVAFMPPLMSESEFDYDTFVASLEDEDFDDRSNVEEDIEFRLAGSIISDPDFCFWNWCTADELEWAIDQSIEDESYLGEFARKYEFEYRDVVQLMREHQNLGFECRFVYFYDFSTSWLDQHPYLD